MYVCMYPSSKQYWLNIGPIQLAILVQYWRQYWADIKMSYGALCWANIGSQYWANITNYIGPILL